MSGPVSRFLKPRAATSTLVGFSASTHGRDVAVLEAPRGYFNQPNVIQGLGRHHVAVLEAPRGYFNNSPRPIGGTRVQSRLLKPRAATSTGPRARQPVPPRSVAVLEAPRGYFNSAGRRGLQVGVLVAALVAPRGYFNLVASYVDRFQGRVVAALVAPRGYFNAGIVNAYVVPSSGWCRE